MNSIKFVLTCFLAAGLFLFALADADAMPKDGSSASFKAMDKDNDGQITKEEFFEAFPNMKDAAFLAIDANNDEIIDQEEWDLFFVSHRIDVAEHDKQVSGMEKEEADATSPKNAEEEKSSTKDAPKLIMPSKK